MDPRVRWNVTVSPETDVLVRTHLARLGLRKGDLSRFIEQAVRAQVAGARHRVGGTADATAGAVREPTPAPMYEAITPHTMTAFGLSIEDFARAATDAFNAARQRWADRAAAHQGVAGPGAEPVTPAAGQDMPRIG